MEYKKTYQEWLQKATDKKVMAQLSALSDTGIEDAFFSELVFGTGGIRGIMGAGTNRLNIYTLKKIANGTAEYIIAQSGLNDFDEKAVGNEIINHNSKNLIKEKSKNTDKNIGHISAFPPPKTTVVVCYDNRNNSKKFAQICASVLADNGIMAVITKNCMPAPYLSFMVRYFSAAAGIMITASHNPKEYNGYKLYGPDGCQLTDKAAGEVSEFIAAADPFKVVHKPYSYYLRQGLIKVVSGSNAYLNAVKDSVRDRTHFDIENPVAGNCCIKNSVIDDAALRKQGANATCINSHKDVKSACKANGGRLKVLYTPLCGTGGLLTVKLLSSVAEVFTVSEQMKPDGDFTFCAAPNPENPLAYNLALNYAKKYNCDLIIATDPDADRMGVMARRGAGGDCDCRGGESCGGENCKNQSTGGEKDNSNSSGKSIDNYDSAGNCKSSDNFGSDSNINDNNGIVNNTGGNNGDSNKSGNNSSGTEEYKFLTGNQIGVLLTYFLLSENKKLKGTDKYIENPLIVRTVVSTPMADKIAAFFGAETTKVLTGFKYIGETIKRLEQNGNKDRFLLGFEDSHGYLSGSYVRDKDGLQAALLISTFAGCLKAQGRSLTDMLEDLYKQFGYYAHKTVSIRLEGAGGGKKIKELLMRLRHEGLPGIKIIEKTDYAAGVHGLYPTDMIEYKTGDGAIIIRPSGTEPLLKIYLTAIGDSDNRCAEILSGYEKICQELVKDTKEI